MRVVVVSVLGDLLSTVRTRSPFNMMSDMFVHYLSFQVDRFDTIRSMVIRMGAFLMSSVAIRGSAT